MSKNYAVIVVGAGAGGLVVAIGAARAGKKTLLIEKGHWGGDCTNFGCVPSKTLIAAAEHFKEGDGAAILKRVRDTIIEVRSHEEPEALKEKGVETKQGVAKFIDPHALEVGGERITGSVIVIATGAYPFVPSVEGLKGSPYRTNETIFDLEEIPRSLIVLGGGPIGCELAQAFARLGAQVTLVHRGKSLLKKEESEASSVIAQQFVKEGIDLQLGQESQSVSYEGGMFTLTTTSGKKIKAHELLVSVGRRPSVDALNLEMAKVEYSSNGICVDKYARTSQKHIFAIGDVLGGPFFTHYAESQGRAVLTSLLIPGPFKKHLSKQPVPRVTFTDPEVASFGLSAEEAIKCFGKKKIAVYHVPFTEVDRAITAGRTEGFVKVVTKKWSSQILGATIVGPRAGEMLPELSMAALFKIPLKKLASMMHAYPTYNLGIRRAADLWLTQTLLPSLKKQ